MIPPARIVHAVPGRMRIKIPSMRRVEPYFAALHGEIQKMPGVTEVRTLPMASSLLLRLEPEIGEQMVARYAREHGLFALEPRSFWGATALAALASGARKVDRKLRSADGEHYDKRTLLILLLLILGIRQARRGEILGPAIALFWNAYTLFGSMGGGSTDGANANTTSHETA